MLGKKKQDGKKDRWIVRRKMAWVSLISGLLFPILTLYTESDQLGSIAGAFYLFIGAIVGAYIGFSTVDDKWHKGEGIDSELSDDCCD